MIRWMNITLSNYPPRQMGTPGICVITINPAEPEAMHRCCCIICNIKTVEYLLTGKMGGNKKKDIAEGFL